MESNRGRPDCTRKKPAHLRHGLASTLHRKSTSVILQTFASKRVKPPPPKSTFGCVNANFNTVPRSAAAVSILNNLLLSFTTESACQFLVIATNESGVTVAEKP